MPERHKWLISMLIVHSPHPRRNTSTSIRVKQHSSWTPIKGGNKSWMYSNQTFLFHLHCDRLMRTLQFTRNHWYNLKWPKALVFCRCLRTYHQFIISLYCIACRSRSLSLSLVHIQTFLSTAIQVAYPFPADCKRVDAPRSFSLAATLIHFQAFRVLLYIVIFFRASALISMKLYDGNCFNAFRINRNYL